MTKVFSFAPMASTSAKVLILGSMPGVASLEANQYYAHPRNAFWPIMQAILEIDASKSYQNKVEALTKANIALWDVLQQCERIGSLDSAIKSGSRIPNDFKTFLSLHPSIQCILFNGAEAEKSFKRHVEQDLDLSDIKGIKLPSTSPAHTLSLEDKVKSWEAAIVNGLL